MRQRFFEGQIVRITSVAVVDDDGLVIPFWHLRVAQPEHRVFHCQAVPIGVWPRHVRWISELDMEATALAWPIWSFDKQDEMFRATGRGSAREARTEMKLLRSALPAEIPLAESLAKLEPRYRGVTVEEFLSDRACRAEDALTPT